jgi:DNA-binding NarL/FixJ family response regulator
VTKPRRFKVLIVDDHTVFREGLIEIIKQDPDLQVCGDAHDAPSALLMAEKFKPDVATVDVSMEGVSGLALTKDLRSRFPEMRILVLSMHKGSVYAERALRAGANGYVMKQESAQRVLAAIRRVLEGGTAVSETINQALLKGLFRQGGSAVSPVERLSASEFEVFKMVADGLGTRQIAENLRISSKTVESHRGHIRRKLGLEAFELVGYARDWAAAGGMEDPK